MKIVKNVNKNEVFDYLKKEIEVHAIYTRGDGVVNLLYEQIATVIGIIENDDYATFIVEEVEE